MAKEKPLVIACVVRSYGNRHYGFAETEDNKSKAADAHLGFEMFTQDFADKAECRSFLEGSVSAVFPKATIKWKRR